MLDLYAADSQHGPGPLEDAIPEVGSSLVSDLCMLLATLRVLSKTSQSSSDSSAHNSTHSSDLPFAGPRRYLELYRNCYEVYIAAPSGRCLPPEELNLNSSLTILNRVMRKTRSNTCCLHLDLAL